MRVYVGDTVESLGRSPLLPWGLGDGTDTGKERVCGGHCGIPGTIPPTPMGTRGWDGHRE